MREEAVPAVRETCDSEACRQAEEVLLGPVQAAFLEGEYGMRKMGLV